VVAGDAAGGGGDGEEGEGEELVHDGDRNFGWLGADFQAWRRYPAKEAEQLGFIFCQSRVCCVLCLNCPVQGA
jgi:hypothetical protein